MGEVALAIVYLATILSFEGFMRREPLFGASRESVAIGASVIQLAALLTIFWKAWT